jgi:hypothetical protein
MPVEKEVPDLSLLPPRLREVHVMGEVLLARIAALEAQEVFLGDPVLGFELMEEDPEGFAWIAWLRPDECGILRGVLGLGSFVNIRTRVTFGPSGRAKKGEVAQRRCIENLAQGYGKASTRVGTGGVVLPLLRRIASMRQKTPLERLARSIKEGSGGE